MTESHSFPLPKSIGACCFSNQTSDEETMAARENAMRHTEPLIEENPRRGRKSGGILMLPHLQIDDGCWIIAAT